MPTALFADNDIIAIYAVRILRELGYRIPEDVSIVGFDNIALLEVLEHAADLRYRFQGAIMGVIAANALIDKINEPMEGVVKIEVRTSLVKRKSVARIQ